MLIVSSLAKRNCKAIYSPVVQNEGDKSITAGAKTKFLLQ
jgi:hypothetical protein